MQLYTLSFRRAGTENAGKKDAELCFTQINDLKQMLSGVLNIGISYTFAPVLMEAVKDFTRQYPGVRLNIICRTMEELLKKREVDFVLCFKPNFKDVPDAKSRHENYY